MENIKTLTCPNCGAHITNLQNCEFCGSLLIRLQQQGLNIEQAGYKDESKIYQGLTKHLERNLELQRTTNHEASIVTLILGEDREPIGGVTNQLSWGEAGMAYKPETERDNKEHLKILFSFSPDNISDEMRLRKFRRLDIYELFDERISNSSDGKIDAFYYAIDFGEDALGAARLISKVFNDVFSLPYETHLDCYTETTENLNKMLWASAEETEQPQESKIPAWVWWVIGVGILLYFLIESGII
jgi:hypothetical protein